MLRRAKPAAALNGYCLAGPISLFCCPSALSGFSAALLSQPPRAMFRQGIKVMDGAGALRNEGDGKRRATGAGSPFSEEGTLLVASNSSMSPWAQVRPRSLQVWPLRSRTDPRKRENASTLVQAGSRRSAQGGVQTLRKKCERGADPQPKGLGTPISSGPLILLLKASSRLKRWVGVGVPSKKHRLKARPKSQRGDQFNFSQLLCP